MDKITDQGVDEETKIEDIAENLFNRIEEETERLLKLQLQKLGVSYADGIVRETFFPHDPFALAIYEYEGIKILGVRIGENFMSIEWDVPKLETQTKGEVQNV